MRGLTQSRKDIGSKMVYQDIFEKIVVEIERARKKHPSFHSHHEAYAVIKEEFEEWWDSVKADDPDPRELLSVAAMAVLALMELPYEALTVRNSISPIYDAIE